MESVDIPLGGKVQKGVGVPLVGKVLKGVERVGCRYLRQRGISQGVAHTVAGPLQAVQGAQVRQDLGVQVQESPLGWPRLE